MPTEPSPFPLTIDGDITVEGISGNCYIVRAPGRTEEGLLSPTTATAENAPLEVPVLLITPHVAPPPPLRQSARVVLLRLTSAEFEALRESTDLNVQRFYDAALAEGLLVESDPDFLQARAYLDALGIIASARWATLLAP